MKSGVVTLMFFCALMGGNAQALQSEDLDRARENYARAFGEFPQNQTKGSSEDHEVAHNADGSLFW